MEQQYIERSKYCSIGDLSERHGVSLRTLRFYEEKGLLKPVRVGTHRLYSARDEIMLKLVRIGGKFGFSLSQIKGMIDGFTERHHATPESITAILEPETIQDAIVELEERRSRVEAAIADLKASASRYTRDAAPEHHASPGRVVVCSRASADS